MSEVKYDDCDSRSFLTKKEIEECIEKARVLFGMPADALEAGLRKIFLGENDDAR